MKICTDDFNDTSGQKMHKMSAALNEYLEYLTAALNLHDSLF